MENLADIIDALKKSKCFFSFDSFLIWKMGFLLTDNIYATNITEQMRLDAYHECMKRIGVNRVAAVQTIQKWFGIHGKSTPGRESIFRLAFALNLSCEETEEYLIEGLGETGFQINDYREVVFLYALQKEISYEEALCLIDEVERKFPDELQMLSHNETNKLWEAFMIKKELDKEEFINWMVSQGSYFKGYSMTALNYLRAFKQEILSEMKLDVRKNLEVLLAETNFYQWEKEKHYEGKEWNKTIPKFLCESGHGSRKYVSDALGKNILELLKILEIPVDSNFEFLREFYATTVEQKSFLAEKRKVAKQIGWNLFDNKYLSELLNIGSQKEKQVNLLLLKRQTENFKRNRRCSKELLEQAHSCGYTGSGKISVEQLGVWADREQVRLGKRIRVIQRRDLLQLILTTAQLRYFHRLEQNREIYDVKEGRRLFAQLADTALIACCMERLNIEKYKIDALFWNCYQQEEIYSVSDLLEMI